MMSGHLGPVGKRGTKMLSLQLIIILGLLFALVVCCMLATLPAPAHGRAADKNGGTAQPEEEAGQTVSVRVEHNTEQSYSEPRL